MFRIERTPCVQVDAPPGVYMFDCESGTGKSYLCDLLKQYEPYGEPVTGFTYSDVRMGKSLYDLLGKNYKVIMLDRYGLYQDEHALNALIDAYPNAIILIECKENFHCKACPELIDIDLKSEGIYVWL